MNEAGVEWSKAAWRAHVHDADEAFAAELGDRSLPALATASAQRYPDRIAVNVDGQSVTHAELDAGAARMAGWLGDRVAPGDRVLLCGPTCLDFVRCYLGTLRAGGVIVLANPSYTADELAHLVDDSGAVLALAAPEQADKLTGLHVESMTVGRDAPAAEPIVPESDDLAILAYTSGTTGRPKGVPLTHRHLVTSIRAAMAAWRWSSDDVLVHALPLFHQHGLSGLNATLIAGSTANILARFDPEKLIEAARGRSVLFAVPTMYERLIDSPDAAEVLGGLRLCVCGSAPLSETLAQKVANTIGFLPLVRYGTTESGLDVSNPYAAPRADTVGIPLPGVLLRLVDGEIQLSGPQVFSGYWRAPQASAEALTTDGWFRTGDIGAIDEDSGHLLIKGRSKELIITGGMNVYPREVEAALERHPDVSEAAVAGLAHEHWGEQVTAWVVPSYGGALDEERLLAHAKSLLAPYKCPKQVLTVDSLPRNHMGKISRAGLDTPIGFALRRAQAATERGAFVELDEQTRFQRGTPIAVKDNIAVAGEWVRNGTSGVGHHLADEDAAAIARLREDGYVPIGRTSMPELAWSMVTPGCRNPWDHERASGGSSGGSAVAVATEAVPVALGSDTGGSIRVPAALCGVAGLRPTHGTAPTAGVSPLAPSMDTVGTIGRNAAACLRLQRSISGAGSTASEKVAGLTIGWPAALWAAKADPEVRRLVESAAATLLAAGAEFVDLELPLSRRYARATGYTIMLAESAQLWWPSYSENSDGLSDAIAELLRNGKELSNTDYEQALERAREIRAELDLALEQVSALLLPTVVVTAGPLDARTVPVGGKQESVESAYYRLTALASVAGLPALTVPAGLSSAGLPVGAQLIGAAFQEALLCQLGTAIENGPEARALAHARTGRNAAHE